MKKLVACLCILIVTLGCIFAQGSQESKDKIASVAKDTKIEYKSKIIEILSNLF